MIKYAYMLLLVLLMSSCALRKKEHKQIQSSSVLESTEAVSKSTTENIAEIDWSVLLEHEDVEINIRRYDTTASPDSLGNFPLKEEESRKVKKKKQKEEQKQIEAQKEENEEYQIEAIVEDNVDEIEKIESAKVVKSPFNFNWLWFLILLVPAYYLIKKFVLKK